MVVCFVAAVGCTDAGQNTPVVVPDTDMSRRLAAQEKNVYDQEAERQKLGYRQNPVTVEQQQVNHDEREHAREMRQQPRPKQ